MTPKDPIFDIFLSLGSNIEPEKNIDFAKEQEKENELVDFLKKTTGNLDIPIIAKTEKKHITKKNISELKIK